MLFYYLIYYSFLAFISRKLFRIQFHSLIHCLNSLILSTYFFYKNNINLFSINVIQEMDTFDTSNDLVLFLCAQNSIGYFLIDFIDILIDSLIYKNSKRNVYLVHHIFAILTLGTVYFDDKFIFGIWCLEIGGLIHHLKHISEVFDLSVKKLFVVIYFIIYPMSRIYFFINILTGLYRIPNIINFINSFISSLLIIQNLFWLIKNIKNSLGLYS